eukprot:scaffold5242_cov287-Chaetoceros_neogracile.AAC.10
MMSPQCHKYRRITTRRTGVTLILLNLSTPVTSLSMPLSVNRSGGPAMEMIRQRQRQYRCFTMQMYRHENRQSYRCHGISLPSSQAILNNVPAFSQLSSVCYKYRCEYGRPAHQQTQLRAASNRANSNYSSISPFEATSPFSIGAETNPNDFLNLDMYNNNPSSNKRNSNANDNINDNINDNSNYNSNDNSNTTRKQENTRTYAVTDELEQEKRMVYLKEDLQQYRKQQSKSLLKPVSSILTNEALDGICAALPLLTTMEDLLKVKGIGPKKVEMFGAGILTIVSMHQQQQEDQDQQQQQQHLANITDNVGNNDDNDKSDESDTDAKEKNAIIKKTQLKDELKEYRMQQSVPIQKPAYTIFSNAALDGIYKFLPTTIEELLDVKGIGPKKAEMFGDDILAIVSKYRSDGDGNGNGNNGNIVPGSMSIPTRPAKIDPASLTPEQLRAAEIPLGKDEQNVFITGSAGTGKSYLLKFIVEALEQQTNHLGDKKIVGVCAPTGVAAIIVGGSTLHSFFGIGLGTGSVSSILQKINKNSAAKKRIDETDVLIIDECSMLSSDLLEKLDAVSREIRKDGNFREKAFGGMQIIAFGDFFQLPPVYRGDGSVRDRKWRPFCFDSPVWSELGLSDNIVELKEVQRQENEEFVSLLNKVRVGAIQETDIRYLNSRCLISSTNPLPTDGIVPTRLYVLNKDVDSENISRLAELKSEEVVCESIDTWRESMPVGTLAATKKKMLDSLSMEMPDEVRLKVGAQVMLTRNKDLEKNLVNGSRGVVERFVEATDEGGSPIPIVRFDCGIVTKIVPVESVRYNSDGGKGCLVRTQIPLKLAWAITIHKSQGSTLTRALLDISSAFEYGQCYVALSRVKSLEGLWLEQPAKLRNIMVSPQVVDFFRQ